MLKERGEYKTKVNKALFDNEKVKNIILGDISDLSKGEVIKRFKSHVKSHLFNEDTVMDAGTYIYYEVFYPDFAPQVKDCQINMTVICQRDIVDDISFTEDNSDYDGYFGNRVDILSELIEETLLSNEYVNKFGIGRLELSSVGAYSSNRFYGVIMNFEVPNFR
jgi:hypothetical protein